MGAKQTCCKPRPTTEHEVKILTAGESEQQNYQQNLPVFAGSQVVGQ